MSVPNDNSRIQYAGNNSTVTPYPVPFLFFENSDLVVVVTNSSGVNTTLALVTDYTVTGAGVETGGQIVTVSAVPTSSTVTIYREVDATQLTQYEDNDRFPASSHERALDKLTMLCQQAIRATSRSIKIRETDSAMADLTKASTTVIGFNGSGNPICLTPDALSTFLNLVSPPQFDRPQATFADSAARAIAVPDYVGQLGTQQDTMDIYIADGLTAGDWSVISFSPGPGSINTAAIADGILSADSTGRAKMADSFITLAKIGAGIFTADSTGRGKFANDFVNSDLLSASAVLAKLPSGTVIQSLYAEYTSNSDLTTVIPLDNTKPQSSEGTQILSISITPSSSSNKLRFRFSGMGSLSTNTIIAALFKDSDADAIATSSAYSSTSTSATPIVLTHEQAAGGTSAQTFKLRIGPNSGTLRLNGTTSGQLFGGTAKATLVIEEIKA